MKWIAGAPVKWRHLSFDFTRKAVKISQKRRNNLADQDNNATSGNVENPRMSIGGFYKLGQDDQLSQKDISVMVEMEEFIPSTSPFAL